MDKYNLYDCAMTKWGKKFQMLMAIEEMAELTQVLIHTMRKNKETTAYDMASEIADVQIMMEQLIQMYEISEGVSIEKKKKLLKLQRYIEAD